MQNLDGEEDEIFLDSLEFQSPPSDSASTGDPSASDYQVWIDGLRSIRERRSRFLRKMHFEGMAPSSPENNRFGSLESRDSDLDSIPQEDRGEKLLAIELAEKIESRRMIIWEKMDLSLGFPQQFQENKMKKKNPRSFWNCFSERSRGKLRKLRRREKKFSSMAVVQEFAAHKGAIASMKFSPDGRYLATGGEDCVVNIWRAVEDQEEEDDCQLAIGGEFLDSSRSFNLAETPLHELHGHTDGVLDLSWSESNHLISSSKDKTVRLWRVGRDHCLQIFHHSNYVTCVQFNPVDESQFISGSIDGKVRIWGVSEARVVDWVNLGDIITAVGYRPDGQGFVAGSVSGDCRFYSSGESLKLEREVRLPGRKKPTGKTITGFQEFPGFLGTQFSPQEPEKILITSSDGKLRIYDGVAETMNKFKVPGRSKGQSSAIFTSDGRFVVSVGEDSSVSVWDQAMPEKEKSTLPCECFFSEAASLAAVRPRQSPLHVSSGRARPASVREADRFSLGAWFFFADFPARVSATWPEENFSLCGAHSIRDVVTAGHDGVIRSFRASGPLDPILLHPRDWKREKKIKELSYGK